MDINQLLYFQKVAELQHMTKAAEELNISQAALSQAIRSLERELGVQLFERVGRNIALSAINGLQSIPQPAKTISRRDSLPDVRIVPRILSMYR